MRVKYSVISFLLSVVRLKLVSCQLICLINRKLANLNPKTKNREPITGVSSRFLTLATSHSSLGFTLPEVIIAMTLAVVVGGLLLVIMVNNTGVFYKESSRVSQGLGANDTLARIRSEIKEAQAVAAGYPVGNPTYTSGANQLVLRLTSIDSSGNIINATYDYAVFAVTEGRLTYQVFPNTAGGSTRKGANEILAKDVSSVLFEYFDTTGAQTGPTNAVNVKITLTLRQKAGKGFETNIATSEANLRNN